MLTSVVEQLIVLLRDHSTLPSALASEAEGLRDRLRSGQLHLAVLGQFKRGKSTLINALLGDAILPSGVLPVTLIPVFLRFGAQPELEIQFLNGHQPLRLPVGQIDAFVNEAHNPENAKRIRQVDLFYPSPMLQEGIVLIDTPGVGSTLKHNTETTLDFLPRCDAAIVVLSSDPPITAAEVEFLQAMKPHIAHFFFVLNKIDYLQRADAAQAKQFLAETLKLGADIDDPVIFAVSARQGLQARQQEDPLLWEQSGMVEFQQALLQFAEQGKQAALEEAVRRKALNLTQQALQLIAVEQQAMQIPLSELEHIMMTFQRYARSAQQKREEVLDRLVGDSMRIGGQLEAAVKALRPRLRSQIAEYAASLSLPVEDSAQVNAFQERVRALLDRERAAIGAQFADLLTGVLRERAQGIRQIREDLRRDASSLLDVPHYSMLGDDIVVELAEPAWAIEHVPISLSVSMLQRWMPGAMRDQHLTRQRDRLVEEFTVRNTEKIRWWVLRTIEETLHTFRRRVVTDLDETIEQIDRALRLGYEQQQSQQGDLETALESINAYQARLQRMKQALEEA